MATITIKINERTSVGKTFLEFLKASAKDSNAIEIIEEKSPYDPEFVKMVKKSAASKKRIAVNNVNDLWESL